MMAKKGRLTELIMEDPPDVKKLLQYSRSKKNFGGVDLAKLAVWYQDVKKKNGPHVTPLQVACWACTKVEVVKTLVKEGWDVNADVGIFGSPLSIALENGHIPIANTLIELGAHTKRFYRDGLTPMYYALSSEKKDKTCVTAVKLLLDAGVSINAVVNQENKEKAIHLAVGNKSIAAVSFLLQKGADVNIQDKDGFTPLHVAVQNNHLDMVKLLLLHDVDLYRENNAQETAMIIAIRKDFTEIVKELANKGYDICKSGSHVATSPFFLALYLCKMEMIKLMVALGADLNKAFISIGANPLHVIATLNRKDIADYLVDNGADLNVTDKNMKTPLQLAIDSGFQSLAKQFIKQGANFNGRNSDGNTLFHQIVPLSKDIIIVLLQFGGDYHARNGNRLTPYHLALVHKMDLKYIKFFIKYGCPYNQDMPVWKNLVEKSKTIKHFFVLEKKFFKGIKENNLELVKGSVMDGAVPTSCSEDMKFPLHFVAHQGYRELVRFLLENNVHSNTLNDEGKPPLYLAAAKGNYEICGILLRYGACYNYHSKKCPKTPRMVANEHQHYHVVELLDEVDNFFHEVKSKKKNAVQLYFAGKFGISFNHHLGEKNSRVLKNFTTLEIYLMFINAVDLYGNTALSKAVKHKRDGNVKDLMKLRLMLNPSCAEIWDWDF